jgi:hypothetical protein
MTRPSRNDELFFSEMRSCHPEHFQCTSGHCVPNELKCDGRADCLDASDESTCCKSWDTYALVFLRVWIW